MESEWDGGGHRSVRVSQRELTTNSVSFVYFSGGGYGQSFISLARREDGQSCIYFSGLWGREWPVLFFF
jgi:hypothetical protein